MQRASSQHTPIARGTSRTCVKCRLALRHRDTSPRPHRAISTALHGLKHDRAVIQDHIASLAGGDEVRLDGMSPPSWLNPCSPPSTAPHMSCTASATFHRRALKERRAGRRSATHPLRTLAARVSQEGRGEHRMINTPGEELRK